MGGNEVSALQLIFGRQWTNLIECWQIKIFFASIFTALFGEYNAGLGAIAILVALDFATRLMAISKGAKGFWKAFFQNVINSAGIRKGLPKILWYMALLVMAHQLNSFTFLGYSMDSAPTELMCAYLGLIEAKSILENLQECGMKNLEPIIGFISQKQKQISKKD